MIFERGIFMSKKKYDLSYTQNRELSWLEFNRRVLDEAMDENVPLLERVKFLSIFTSNLDEFFMVRVGSLFDLSVMTPNDLDNKSGETPEEQLKNIFHKTAPMIKYRDIVYETLCENLKENGIEEIAYENLEKNDKKYIENYYKLYISPIISPQIIDHGHPFPHLKNKELYIAAILKKDKKEMLGIVDVPENVDSIINLPSKKGKFIRTENIIKEHISDYFSIYEISCSAVISVTRNADISFDDDKFDESELDFSSKMTKLLKKRDRLAPVRLEMEGFESDLAEILAQRLALKKHQIFYSKCPLKTSYVFKFNDFDKNMYYPEFTQSYPDYLCEDVPMWDQIQQRDILLFYPYNSMKPFLQLLKEAADDSSVISIKITLYRLASNSEVANYLCRAAENGKEVTALVELRARFDEQNNIDWSKRLEESGCRVIYGMAGFKCHSKICLITKKTKNGFSNITQIGTGNYNEKTAAQYTDFSLITADKNIAEDATEFFKNMLTGNLYGNYSHLLVAPNSMKNHIIDMIDREIQKGAQGNIIIKANSVTERSIIDKLHEASSHGVKIQMIIRGICCILPGIEGKTENISVISIVGRFLEHSRVYSFGSGSDQKIYISSADIMTRNQTHRVEIACPIYDENIKQWLIHYLYVLTKDNVKARIMMPDGTYIRKPIPLGAQKLNSQEWFMENPPEFEKTKIRHKGISNSLSLFVKKIFHKNT
jgi:polyphosphate kinase